MSTILHMKKNHSQLVQTQSRLSQLGRLYVRIVSANDLLSYDLNGLSDPYCVMSLYDDPERSYKTRVKYMTLKPVWDQEFVLDVEESGLMLRIDMFDHDTVGKDDFMGSVSVDVDTLEKNQLIKLRLPLTKEGKKSKNRGVLCLEVKLWRYSNFIKVLSHPSSPLARALCTSFSDDMIAQSLTILWSEMGIFEDLIELVVDIEVNHTEHEETLFRGDSIATKIMKQTSKVTALPWLQYILKEHIIDISNNPHNFEIDPYHIPEGEDIEINRMNLIRKVNDILDSIIDSVNECPWFPFYLISRSTVK
eukprot:TRINITY_DN1114_c0_g1_i2.p1 TRINITY_DN1114_c0_g1~~TRINITY_DN1114_c0_g1_i2.p1  ORF type:complete len:306 (+),score=60.60 TRINITY_DN1114_c0_g1_i2:31-948(+)